MVIGYQFLYTILNGIWRLQALKRNWINLNLKEHLKVCNFFFAGFRLQRMTFELRNMKWSRTVAAPYLLHNIEETNFIKIVGEIPTSIWMQWSKIYTKLFGFIPRHSKLSPSSPKFYSFFTEFVSLFLVYFR